MQVNSLYLILFNGVGVIGVNTSEFVISDIAVTMPNLFKKEGGDKVR